MLCTNLLGCFPGVACIGWMTHRQMVLNARIALRTCIQHWYSCRSVCEPCIDDACCLHLLFLHEELKTFTSICIAGTYCHFPLQCRRVTQSTLHSATNRACRLCFYSPPPPPQHLPYSLTWCILIAEENQYIVTCIFIFAFCVCVFMIRLKKKCVIVFVLCTTCAYCYSVYAVYRSVCLFS